MKRTGRGDEGQIRNVGSERLLLMKTSLSIIRSMKPCFADSDRYRES